MDPGEERSEQNTVIARRLRRGNLVNPAGLPRCARNDKWIQVAMTKRSLHEIAALRSQ